VKRRVDLDALAAVQEAERRGKLVRLTHYAQHHQPVAGCPICQFFVHPQARYAE
jgi:hypothetical protein